MWQYNTNYLCHHGILGQKWGVRRFQNADGTLTEAGRKRYKVSEDFNGRILPKKSPVYRVSSHPMDPTVNDRKYVSINEEDHDKWKKYLGPAYAQRGRMTFDVTYNTNKDLKIAHYSELGNMFMNELAGLTQQQMIDDSNYARKKMNNYETDDLLDVLSLNIAASTKTGEAFINNLKERGYNGIEDNHGRNVSKDPIIIFDPDKNLKKKSTYINNYT